MSVGSAKARVDTLQQQVNDLQQQVLFAPTYGQANALGEALQSAANELAQARQALETARRSAALANTVMVKDFSTAASSATAAPFQPSLNYATTVASAVTDVALAGAFGTLAINNLDQSINNFNSTPSSSAPPFTYTPYPEPSNYYSPYENNNFSYYSPYSQMPMGLSDLADTNEVVQLRQEEIRQDEKEGEIRRRIQANENFRKYQQEQRIHQETSQRLISMQNRAYAESLKGQPLWNPQPVYSNSNNNNSGYSGFTMPPLSATYDYAPAPAPDPVRPPPQAPQPDPPPDDGPGTAAKAY